MTRMEHKNGRDNQRKARNAKNQIKRKTKSRRVTKRYNVTENGEKNKQSNRDMERAKGAGKEIEDIKNRQIWRYKQR